MAENWVSTVVNNLRQRNQRECPKERIEFFNAHEQLWRKSVFLDNRRESLRHKLACIEHETAESARTGTLESYQRAVSSALVSLSELQAYLGAHNEHNSARDTNLSRIIFDQRRTLQRQSEEMNILKEELNNSISRCAAMESELHDQREHAANLEAELSKLRSYVTNMDEENALLKEEQSSMIERFVAEKMKAAVELNEMNKIFDDAQRSRELAERLPSNTSLRSSAAPSPALTDDFVLASGVTTPSTVESANPGALEVALPRPPAAVGMTWKTIEASEAPAERFLIEFEQDFGSNSAVTAIRQTGDGASIITAGMDAVVRIIDKLSVSPVHQLLCSDCVISMDVINVRHGASHSVDGKGSLCLALCADQKCKIWDTETGKLLNQFHFSGNYGASIIRFAGELVRHVLTCGEDEFICVWSLPPGHQPRSLNSSQHGLLSSSMFVASKTAQLINKVPVQSAVTSIEFGQYHSTFVTGHKCGNVAVWDTGSFDQLWVVQGFQIFPPGSISLKSGFSRVAAHPQDSSLFLVSLHSDSSPVTHEWGLFSTEHMRIVQVYQQVPSNSNSVPLGKLGCFSPTGAFVAVASATGKEILVYATRTGDFITEHSLNISSSTATTITAMDWSSTSETIAYGDLYGKVTACRFFN